MAPGLGLSISALLSHYQKAVCYACKNFTYLEEILLKLLGQKFYANSFTINNGLQEWQDVEEDGPFDNSILWAAPKSRRSIEKRRTRRIGLLDKVCKLIPLKKLKSCIVCGYAHEIGHLCPNCYSNNRNITNEIKLAMRKADGRGPIEHDYHTVYIGDTLNSKDEFFEVMYFFCTNTLTYKERCYMGNTEEDICKLLEFQPIRYGAMGKRILEVPVERPSWFSKKLTQQSNVTISQETRFNIPDKTKINIEDK